MNSTKLSEFILGMDDGSKTVSKIRTDMLDYTYVENCEDVATLREILRVLTSGKEGRFLDLELTVGRRILSLLPAKDRKKILALCSAPSTSDIDREKESLEEWIRSISLEQGEIITALDHPIEPLLNKEKRFPPVRCDVGLEWAKDREVEVTSTASSGENRFQLNMDGNRKVDRISKEMMSNRDYFRAWDKYDVDAAEKAIDSDDNNNDTGGDSGDENANEDKSPSVVIVHTSNDWKSKMKTQEIRTIGECEQLRKLLKIESLSNSERQFIATQEKDKGNEFFRIKDYEKAVKCYSKSIALNGNSATVYANRAMAFIRLSDLCQATADCSRALDLDPDYTKALARRGMIHHKCGRYMEAMKDFEDCASREPDNKEYRQLLNQSTKKYIEVIGEDKHEKMKKRIAIVYDDDSESDEKIEEIYTPGAFEIRKES